ncbi:DUF6764 family protein [Williamsia sp. MIQD14]|uniref:DUF6764 family protein n=1 Tax=Williamsia sp. MIQD14 TaxID=3425703 RepID=UPI003DA1A73D
MSTTAIRRFSALGAFTLLAGAGIALGAAPAAAAPLACPALPGQTATTPDCTATSTGTGTSAAIGDTPGAASANGGRNGLSLGIGLGGGKATSQAQNLNAAAAIASGRGAVADLTGIKPGLSIGIAGPGATVTVNGRTGATCTGGIGFAGDFQTFSGCINFGNGEIPLGNR